MKTYRDLRVWTRSIDLVELVYRLSDTFPIRERHGLAAQIRGAAVSIPSNIAEGQGRITKGEWLQFLGHARGSVYEVETHLVIAGRLKLINDDELRAATECVGDVAATLTGLIDYVRRQANRRRE